MIVGCPPISLVYTSVKIAFITGLSNPKSCSLSKIQRQFMSRLEVPEKYKLYYNFPYAPSEGEEKEPLWKASFENVNQYLRCRQPYYQQQLHLHLESLAASCDQIIFLSGSCGLEMLNVALSASSQKKLAHVFAYAPVARKHPEYPCTLIQGSRDYLSQVFFKPLDKTIQGLGHMDYLQHPEVFEIVQQGLRTYAY
jgi:hypothetical protein